MRAWNVLRLGDDENATAVGGGVASVIIDVVASTYGQVTFGSSVEQVTCSVSLNSNGTISGDISGAWFATQTAGIGSSYWAIVTLTTGTVTTGTTASRVSLAAGHTWSVVTTGSGSIRVKNAVGTIQIWDAASGGNMVSSGIFTIEAYAEGVISGDGSRDSETR
jgi:hypothetical protein